MRTHRLGAKAGQVPEQAIQFRADDVQDMAAFLVARREAAVVDARQGLDDGPGTFDVLCLVRDEPVMMDGDIAGKINMGIGGINACVICRKWKPTENS